MQSPIIQFDHVSRRFGGRDALQDIDLQVSAGIIEGLVGSNDSGKRAADMDHDPVVADLKIEK